MAKKGKLMPCIFPRLEGPDGPHPPPPPVGTCQSVSGWGYFEWDGNNWVRQVDDISYSHQEMWECLVGNDQRFLYAELDDDDPLEDDR